MGYLIAAAVITICGGVMVSPMFFTTAKIKNFRGTARETFLATLVKDGVPERISEAVFDFYKSKARWEPFSPSPEMDINAVFEEGAEDIDDAAIDLLKQLHLDQPSELIRRGWPGGEVRTARDLARWLHWASQQQPI